MMIRMSRAITARLGALRVGESQGFTLIELLVVVIIVGVLAAVVIPVYLGIQNNAKDNVMKTGISDAKTAVVAYAADNNGSLPASLALVDLPAKYGYVTPAAAGNYASPGAIPILTRSAIAGSMAFCVYAVGATGTKVGASDLSGVASSGTTACAVGVLIP